MLYLVQSKICKAAVFHSGKRLFSSYSSGNYTAMLEDMVTDGLANKIPLSTDDYRVRDIRLAFHVTGDRVEYVFTCSVEFYVYMFGRSYPAITRPVELTGYNNTKF